MCEFQLRGVSILFFHRCGRMNLYITLVVLNSLLGTSPAKAGTINSSIITSKHGLPLLFNHIQRSTFNYFWDTANPTNGLVPDNWPGSSTSSIAAVGFALSAYPIGVERGYITREQAIQRVLVTLRFFHNAPEGPQAQGMTGYHGFFYHWLNLTTGARVGHSEVSTIDTSLLLGGVLFSEQYFDRDTPQEREIRKLAKDIYDRVDWPWMQHDAPLISMAWRPGSGFVKANWQGLNEGMILYVLAIGSPTHPISGNAWAAWAKTYPRTWGQFYGRMQLGFGPLFGHQYSEAWIDFRGIQDAFMRRHHLTYFKNSQRATESQRSYAIANPEHWTGYGPNIWGLTACDGPGRFTVKAANGQVQTFRGYSARGMTVHHWHSFDDGTIAPTAALSSIAFAPKIVIPAAEAMYKQYGTYLYGRFGFKDAFNPSFIDTHAKLRSGKVISGVGWFDNRYLSIDEGPIVLMIQNYRDGLVWRYMRRSPAIRRGLLRAGFRGGWLRHPAR